MQNLPYNNYKIYHSVNFYQNHKEIIYKTNRELHQRGVNIEQYIN
jgi:hypothetical protein